MQQMELSRAIKDKIRELMDSSYREAEQASGQGMDLRQKAIIKGQVQNHGLRMFRRASELLNDELEELLATLEKKLRGLIDEMVRRLERAMVTASADEDDMQTLRCIREQCAETIAKVKASSALRRETREGLKAQACEKEALGAPKGEEGVAATPHKAARIGEVATPQKAPPHEFNCPISQTIMVEPVITADGQTYERREIEAWLVNHQTSPITNLPHHGRTSLAEVDQA